MNVAKQTGEFVYQRTDNVGGVYCR